MTDRDWSLGRRKKLLTNVPSWATHLERTMTDLVTAQADLAAVVKTVVKNISDLETEVAGLKAAQTSATSAAESAAADSVEAAVAALKSTFAPVASSPVLTTPVADTAATPVPTTSATPDVPHLADGTPLAS